MMILAVLIGLGFVVAAVAFTLATYFAMRRVTGADPDGLTKDLASSVLLRISALHGLILALVFAQEMLEYQRLRLETATEANALADIYFDADRYGGSETIKIKDTIYAYVGQVLKEEWRALGTTGRLTGQGWALWDKAYAGILDLTPVNERQTSLRAHMLDRVHVVAEMRVNRENHGQDSTNTMFWFAAIFGILFIAMAYYAYPPRRLNLVLISLFGAYTGLVLFFIYAFSNPYNEPAAMNPGAMERLQDQLDRSRAAALGPGLTGRFTYFHGWSMMSQSPTSVKESA
jgi:hypothetical protein